MTTPATREQLEAQVDLLLSQLELSEKLHLLGGQPKCGATFGCERIGLPPLRMSDGPMGVHWWCGQAVAYPALICAAASWDPLVWWNLGQALGQDCRARGVHLLLAPGVNQYRSPLCGRNFEYCGEDPYLSSRVGVEFIRGVQSCNVSCTVKHFAANFQEYDRHNVSSDIDERTLQEIYLPAFKAAVIEAECGALMTAYNPLNGVHCSESAHLIRDILKGDWAFDGLVMSDWTSTYDPIAAANAGLDLEMPTAEKMCANNLAPALENGKVSQDVIDDKIRRLLRLALRFGWFTPNFVEGSIDDVDTRNRGVALDVARAGIVLLKNERGVLPLDDKTLKKVAVIGPNAHPCVFSGGGSALTNPTRTTSTLEGIQSALQGRATVTHANSLAGEASRLAFGFGDFESELGAGLKGEYFEGPSFEGTPARVSLDSRIDFKWGPSSPLPESAHVEFSVRWTGKLRVNRSGLFAAYFKTFNNACRVWIDGQLLLDSWNSEQHGVAKQVIELTHETSHSVIIEWAKRQYWSGMQFGLVPENGDISSLDDCVSSAKDADAAILCVGFNEETEGEGFDRPFAMDVRQEELIRAIAAVQSNTVVVVNAGGAVDMRQWLHTVPAVVYAFYPGQEGGQALAEILFGKCEPSGRLPFTMERNPEDRSAFDCYHADPETKRVELKDKLEVGYRHFDRRELEPLFPFGFGLSYTQFSMSNLELSKSAMLDSESIEVAVDVCNEGGRMGCEVVQVYVSDLASSLPRPVKELKAFKKVTLGSGERQTVKFVLDRRALEFYDPNENGFVVEAGRFAILVGSHARSTPLRAEFDVVQH